MWKCDRCREENDDSVEDCYGCGLSKADSIVASRKAKRRSFLVTVIVVLAFVLFGAGMAIFVPETFDKWVAHMGISIAAAGLLALYKMLRR